MKTTFLSAVLNLTLCLMSASLFGQSQSGGISGKLSNLFGSEPVVNASVILKQHNTIIVGCQTDSEGNYSFNPVKPDEYQLEVVANNFQSCKLSQVLVKPGAQTLLNVKLKAIDLSDNFFPVDGERAKLSFTPTLPGDHTANLSCAAEQSYPSMVIIRNCMGGGKVIYIDGVKVRPSSALARTNSTPEVRLIDPWQTGGTTADIGDGLTGDYPRSLRESWPIVTRRTGNGR